MAPKRKSTRLTARKSTAAKTARKSTGAPAPRRPIGSGGFAHDVPAVPTATTTRKRQRVSDDESNNVTEERLDEAEERSDEAEDRLDYQEHFARTAPDACWCRGCDDDTVLEKVTCENCGHLVCYGPPDSGTCIEIRAQAITNPCWASFRCPACEFQAHREGSKKLFQYTGFYDEEGNGVDKLILTIRNRKFTFFKSMRLEGLAVIQLELNGQNEDLELAFQLTTLRAATYASGVVSVDDVLNHSLRNPPSVSVTRSHPQPLLKAKIIFDFNSPEGINRHTRNMNDLVLALDRMGITQIVFLVVTHADPDSGDLHYAPNGVAAESLPVVMGHLFPHSVQQWLVEHRSYLFLLVCGAKPLTKDGYHFMTDLATRCVFNHSFMFPTAHLQPAEVANFISYFVERALYENIPVSPAVLHCLEDLPRLGLHTRVLQLSAISPSAGKPACEASRYLWSQSQRRPWGLDAPTFCSACNSVKSFRPDRESSRDRDVVFRCMGFVDPNKPIPCTNQITITLSRSEAKLAKGPSTQRGIWQQHPFVWDQDIMARF
ncbi:hypothetical protein K435DRAFT_878136 [Dendrothele bispora CBS 962.96]|uniref:Uncharacterized protein n=1 Tax=Dendrothele bispora (strain CBS 962.96) TaxID=1314807 RepID=A0A4S8KNR1_DENBC|nr:hypothetical protein K435DRAFT_878136 [Dendrothele bispora CBS 962.96]